MPVVDSRPMWKKKQPEVSPSSPGLEHDRKVIGDFVREVLAAEHPDQDQAVIAELTGVYTDEIMAEVKKLPGGMGLDAYARAVGEICRAWEADYRS